MNENVSRETLYQNETGETDSVKATNDIQIANNMSNPLISMNGADDILLLAEDLRRASHSLGRITGDVDIEDLLDIIFRDFCVGK